MSLSIVEHPAVASFLERATPFLAAHELECGLIWGVARLNAEGSPATGQDWWTVEQSGVVAGAVMRTPPFHPSLSPMSPAAALAVARAYAARPVFLSGVFGPASVAADFAREWQHLRGGAVSLFMPHWLSICRRLPLVDVPRHSVRLPRDADVDAVAGFLIGFHQDVQTPPSFTDPREAAARWIAHQSGLLVEADGVPAAMVSIGRETPRGATITLVYCAPEFRGRGCATAGVAEITRRQFALGKEFCCLFSDPAAAAPNRVYRKLGYELAGDFEWWRFTNADA
jgi:predicted GNAT family acetyltransferase